MPQEQDYRLFFTQLLSDVKTVSSFHEWIIFDVPMWKISGLRHGGGSQACVGRFDCSKGQIAGDVSESDARLKSNWPRKE